VENCQTGRQTEDSGVVEKPSKIENDKSFCSKNKAKLKLSLLFQQPHST